MNSSVYRRNFRHLVAVITLILGGTAESSPIACENAFSANNSKPTTAKGFTGTTTRPSNTNDQLLRRQSRERALRPNEIPDFAALQRQLNQNKRPSIPRKSSFETNLTLPDQTTVTAHVERFPISSHDSSADGGFLQYSASYYEKTTYRRGPIFVEKHEVKVHQGIPKEVMTELHRLSVKWGYKHNELPDRFIKEISTYGRLRSANDQYIYHAWDRANRAGKKIHDKNLAEILKFTLAQYGRRNWTPEFVEHLIANAYSALRKTDYVVVREVNENGKPGKIIGSIGYTRSTYAKYKYFNSKTKRWEEHLQNLDTRYLPSKTSSLSTKDISYSSAIEVLPMEEFFGPHYELPRPELVDFVHDGKSVMPRPVEDAIKNYMNADTTKPSAIYTGQIFEPVKFAISKDAESRQITYSAVLLELFNGVFNSDRPGQFNSQAQRLYTYNTKEGVVMYRHMGFKEMGPQWSHRDQEGVEWFALELSPKSMIETLTNPNFMRGRVAQDFANEFQDSIARTLEAQNISP